MKPSKPVLAFFLGKPVIGKGVAGRSLRHFYPDEALLNLHVMRDKIKQAGRTDPELAEVMCRCEQERKLVPSRYIEPIITSSTVSSHFEVWDGAPRNGRQATVFNDTFRRQVSRFVLIEFIADDEYVNEAFRLTMEADDRKGRLDCRMQTHLDGVLLYNKNLAGIQKKARQYDWKHVRINGKDPLEKKVEAIIKGIGLPPVSAPALAGLEAALQLKSEHRPSVAA